MMDRLSWGVQSAKDGLVNMYGKRVKPVVNAVDQKIREKITEGLENEFDKLLEERMKPWVSEKVVDPDMPEVSWVVLFARISRFPSGFVELIL